MFKKILLVFVFLLVVLVVVGALQLADFRVERGITVSSPASIVFSQVNDFHKWEAWSPWTKLDPSMKMTFEGPPAGPGAIYTWTGNNKVGEGRMTIQESHPSESIGVKLEFIKPFSSTANTEFTFKPIGNQTAVTWTMSGHNNLFSKILCLFMSMDKMVGGDFERGLANLKAVSENTEKR